MNADDLDAGAFVVLAVEPWAAAGAITGDDNGEEIEIEEEDSATGYAEEEEEEEYAYAGDDDRGGFRLWLPWIIGLLAAILILWWLLSMMDGCGGNRANMAGADGEGASQEQVITAGPDEAMAEADESSMEGSDDAMPEVSANADGAGSTGEPPAPLGPSAAALGFAPGSFSGKIADFLSSPERSLPASFVMDKVSFPRHSAKLNKSAYDQVDNLIALLKAYPDLKITFEGHIDATEDDGVARSFMNGENITLSAVRARCLYQKFIESGISESQLDFEGYGASKPLVDNNSAQNRQTNRRLEVSFSAK